MYDPNFCSGCSSFPFNMLHTFVKVPFMVVLKRTSLTHLKREFSTTQVLPFIKVFEDFFDKERSLEYSANYPVLTAADAAKESTTPKSSVMLSRDFIDNSLYNPHYGYFSKQAMIFSSKTDFNFNEMKDNLEFLKILSNAYKKIEDELDATNKFARQVWHTPAELFKPWYGYAVAKYIVEQYKIKNYPHTDLIVYEVGAGNGTLMLNILEYIQKYEPSIYRQTSYRMIEISEKLSELQSKRKEIQKAKHDHDCVEIINKSIFEWNEVVPDPCFFLAFEVLDNFSHDIICYDHETKEPLQAVVIIDEKGEYEEVYEPISDPLVQRYLYLRSQTTYKTPILHKGQILRKIRQLLPYPPTVTLPEFIPTKCLLFLEVLKKYFPQHRLIISDFYELPHTIPGVDAPVVQTRFKRSMVPCSTYMVQPGYFDIFFPTNFDLLKAIYQLACEEEEEEEQEEIKTTSGQEIRIFSHKEFLATYADIMRTRTRSGENPMLMYYQNAKFMLT
ncbi:hypothetical protein G9A89_022224 [Geosiphon pyriformis]|nr:hypothetical protein G9A89_022224 [Geosiphon pyriformis]